MRWLTRANADELRRLVKQDEFFWLDLLRPPRDVVSDLIETVGLDPEAAARALRFGDVPQLRRFRDHVGLVFFGAEPAGGPADLVEVHVFVHGGWLVTVRERDCRALDELRAELRRGRPVAEEAVVARLLGALAGSFEDLLDPLDEQVERIEHAAAQADEPERGLRQRILDQRGALLPARRLVRRQRDYIERAIEELTELPGIELGQRHELRDVSGQMIRVADAIDDALDRLAAALDLLNSRISNRLNAIMERLTVVATIFLPLTVVTSFFGQNFAWLVRHIDSLAAFLTWGLGLFAASGIGIYLWMRRRLERGDVA